MPSLQNRHTFIIILPAKGGCQAAAVAFWRMAGIRRVKPFPARHRGKPVQKSYSGRSPCSPCLTQGNLLRRFSDVIFSSSVRGRPRRPKTAQPAASAALRQRSPSSTFAPFICLQAAAFHAVPGPTPWQTISAMVRNDVPCSRCSICIAHRETVFFLCP